MEFLQNLSEAKLIGNSKSGLKRFNARELADILFLYFNAIQILKSEFYGAADLQQFINKTGPLSNVDNFTPSKNDLYVLLHVLFGKRNQAQFAMLKDQAESEELVKTLRINMPEVRKFLLLAKNGKSDPSFERRFLLSLEQGLRIQDSKYRSIRRLAQGWAKESESTKSLVMTRLLQIFRSKARRADLLPTLEKVAKKGKMEDKSLDKMEKEGLGQKEPKSGSLLKTLGLATAAGAGAYYLTRGKK